MSAHKNSQIYHAERVHSPYKMCYKLSHSMSAANLDDLARFILGYKGITKNVSSMPGALDT